MTSRELVKKSLEFDSPPRIPRQIWTLPWASDRYPEQLKAIQSEFPDDIISSPAFLRMTLKASGDPYTVGTFIDEWGCIFENRQQGVIGEVKQPALKDWQDLEQLRFPEELLSVDVEAVNAFCKGTDKFVLAGTCPRPFERLQFIRKTENLMVDLIEHPVEFERLLHKVHEFFLKELELWVATDVDGLTFMDDWGAQRALLISPTLWRNYFKPLYKDYIDMAHSHGKYIFMHSDGHISAIIPDMVELGLDALNSQLFCMDIEDIGRKFRGKITFWGEIDRQYILPFGTPEEVIHAVRRVKEALYQDGGVIAQCEFSAGGKPENVYLVFKTWQDLFR
jgi:uroporphyrinogen-III decarboxylase